MLGAGSSTMWQAAALGAFNQLAGSGAQHYTVSGTCTAGGNCAQIHDSRSTSILNEGGDLWVVWTSDMTQIWAYISVDSLVGNRAYFAAPRATLQVDPLTETVDGVPPGQTNLISSNLWGLDATALPSAVYTALNNAAVTAAFTDILPPDAKAANCRVLNQLNPVTYAGLGYGKGTTCTTLIGTQILSAFSGAVANPVNFNIKGTDPFTGDTISAYTTLNVGASPILFLVNRTNPNGLGYGGSGTPAITDLSVQNAQKIFNGDECDTNAFGADGPPTDVPVFPMLREPLSGAMDTTEFTTFRCGGSPCAITGANNKDNSQEVGVNPRLHLNNPLDLSCVSGGGKRQRAIGTTEMVGTAIKNKADSVGYAFFSYRNVAQIAGSPSYGYLTQNGIDPIQATYTDGQLPVCVSSTGVTGVCPSEPGTSFPNLRNGTYTAWSLLRVVTDASGANLTNAKSLVSAIEDNVNITVPDFVPYNAVGGDRGMALIRSHFSNGGDVGGCIESAGSTVLNCHQ
ncbi:MAG: hypothetical protein ABSH32_11945 [Bryobacteraceae bacterium]|jgi:hypothetical protein